MSEVVPENGNVTIKQFVHWLPGPIIEEVVVVELLVEVPVDVVVLLEVLRVEDVELDGTLLVVEVAAFDRQKLPDVSPAVVESSLR